MNTDQLSSILSAIDAINSKDPQQIDHQSRRLGAAQLYGLRMSNCLEHFCTQPSIALIIATRAQHIERWHISRDSYPMDRPGYHRWRTELAKHHAEVTAKLLREQQVGAELIDDVTALLKKENIKSNADTQTLEDVACLVFLEFHLADFASKHTEQKLISIIGKTWRKMSDAGHQAALKISYQPHIESLITKALKA